MSSLQGSSPFLKIRDLTKRFGHFTALKNIELDVLEGEFVCFLGPSGCGKTTLLRAIAGLDIQSEGSIEQAGRDISALPPSQRDFGIVFQSYALFPNLTVTQNVAYGLKSRGRPKAEIKGRVAELLALVGLPDQGGKHPAQLSGGQQQRVALARAIATSPGLLLLDEPLSALDAKVRVYLRHEIKSLQRKLGVTTIMVTHDQEEALTMADRIVVMNQGVIEQVGTPLDVYRNPASAFVADFVGTMNLAPGTVSGEGKVMLGDAELGCELHELTVGHSVSIAVRPEDIELHHDSEPADNTLRMRVDSMDFMGSFYRATLHPEALRDSALFADISINRVKETGVAQGDSIVVRMPPECLRLYPGDE